MKYLRLIRIKHWVKNLLIFLPMILTNFDWHYQSISLYILGFLFFSFLASTIYVFNDMVDFEDDRKHPEKKNRPIASGLISMPQARGILVVCLLLVILLGIYLQNLHLYLLGGAYIIMNIFYSYWGKQIKFMDIFFLISFYLLRIIFGFEIEGLLISQMFILVSITLFSSLAINKRLNEFSITNRDALISKNYTINDQAYLRILSVSLSLISLLIFNIHNIFVLEVHSIHSTIAINFLGLFIIFNFFDHANTQSDETLHKILRSKKIIIAILVFLVYYAGIMRKWW